MSDYFLDGGLGDEAKVPRSRSRTHCLWLELFSNLVEIDLLLSEPQRLSIPERDQFHAQSRRVKGDGCIHAGYGENQVVTMIDNKSHTHTLKAGGGGIDP